MSRLANQRMNGRACPEANKRAQLSRRRQRAWTQPSIRLSQTFRAAWITTLSTTCQPSHISRLWIIMRSSFNITEHCKRPQAPGLIWSRNQFRTTNKIILSRLTTIYSSSRLRWKLSCQDPSRWCPRTQVWTNSKHHTAWEVRLIVTSHSNLVLKLADTKI